MLVQTITRPSSSFFSLKRLHALSVQHVLCIGLSMLALLVAPNSFASERKLVEKQFRHYWTAFCFGKFDQAVEYIYESDLQAMKKEFVPVFEEALQSRDEKVRQVGKTFFSGIAEDQRGNLSTRDVFERVTRIGFSGSQDALQILQRAPMVIDKVEFHQKNEVSITYHLKVNGQDLESDRERMIRVDGKWFLRLKDVQHSAAALRQALFGAKN